MHLVVYGLVGGVKGKEAIESGFLPGNEVPGPGAQGRQIASVFFDLRSELAEHVGEVLLDDSSDLEAICYDLSIREVSTDQGPVGCRS